jgi:diketogulonate reductase-like aldo/keto reductase
LIILCVFRIATIPVDLLSHKKVTKIAEKYKKTNAQVLLRHLTQQNVVVIPKSITPERIVENIQVRSTIMFSSCSTGLAQYSSHFLLHLSSQVFDFQLSEDELKELDSLDRGEEGRSFLFKMLPG